MRGRKSKDGEDLSGHKECAGELHDDGLPWVFLDERNGCMVGQECKESKQKDWTGKHLLRAGATSKCSRSERKKPPPGPG